MCQIFRSLGGFVAKREPRKVSPGDGGRVALRRTPHGEIGGRRASREGTYSASRIHHSGTADESGRGATLSDTDSDLNATAHRHGFGLVLNESCRGKMRTVVDLAAAFTLYCAALRTFLYVCTSQSSYAAPTSSSRPPQWTPTARQSRTFDLLVPALRTASCAYMCSCPCVCGARWGM